ncbi:ferrochelatase [Paenibacillus sp. FSL W8-0426]|uniref:ferrochelatase n=1 Tax=Paenibacillus sp. FSL W8-0426 TaxID=2921714 RepID=UPI0030D6E05E
MSCGIIEAGVKRPFVAAPGFITDGLETLHELGIEGREQFAQGGIIRKGTVQRFA